MHHPTSFHSSSWKRTPTRQPQQRISSADARRHYHATIMLHLNRVLFHVSEIDIANNGNDLGDEDDEDLHGMKEDDDGTRRSKSSIDTVRSKKKLPTTSRSNNTNHLATVTLPRDDYRTIHVAKILKLQNGDTLRVGIVRHRQRTTNHYHNRHNIHHSTNSKVANIANHYNGNDDSNNLAGLLTDNATITWIPEGKNKLAQPTKNGDPPGSLCITIPHPIMTQSSTTTTASSSSSMIIKNQIISTRLDDDNDKENISATTMFNDNDDTTTNDDDHNDGDVVPRVSLLLALPRPLQLQRLLPMVAQIGVEHIVLTNANKVPKDYFGCRILRNDNNNNNNNDNNNSDDDDNNKDDNIALQNLLIEGLSICGNDVTLPTVTITKRLRILLANGGELDRLFPRELYARVIAHPTRLLPLVDDDGTSSRSNIDDDDGISSDVERTPIVTTRRMADVVFPINTQQQQRQPKRMLVAVGPEGGWEEPYELIMFANAGFQQVSLGARVLRSDVAVVSLLALANDVCYS